MRRRVKINVDFSNNIEAMFERSHVKVKVEPRSTSRLSSTLYILPLSYIYTSIACVASVSSRGSSRKLGQEQKKMNDGGGGEERRFRSNFRAITRLETLATQANTSKIYVRVHARDCTIKLPHSCFKNVQIMKLHLFKLCPCSWLSYSSLHSLH